MSQAEILFFALTEYRDSRRQQYEEGIREGEFDGAFTDINDAQVAQNILDELQMSAFELASQNYAAGHYKGNDERFRSEKATEAAWHEKEYNEFLALHQALPEEPESDTTSTEPTPEA